LCGEFLSGEVYRNIQELEIAEQFLSLSPNPINSFKVFFESGKNISGKIDFNAYALKRSVFDSFLIENAKKKGAEILQPAEVKEIEKDKGEFVLKIKYNNEENVLKTKILIAAYGKQNELDNKLKRNFGNIKSRLNGVKFHINKKYLNSFNDNEIHLYTGDNLYCGINSVDSETAALCFLEQRKNSNTYRDSLFHLFKINPSFGKVLKEDFFRTLKAQKVYGTGNLYLGTKSKAENGIIMIGDAAGVISPFAGDGIGMAFDSAKLAAECISLRNTRNLKVSEISDLYEIKWRKQFNRRIMISKLLQSFLLNSSFKQIASRSLFLLNHFPYLNTYLLKATRT
jgi:flavin-dependent dehydrogenase